jgi:hypothetical protein
MDVDTAAFRALQERVDGLDSALARVLEVVEPTVNILEVVYRAAHAAGRESVLGRSGTARPGRRPRHLGVVGGGSS